MKSSEEINGISVVICTYNNSDFLENCIESVLSQRFAPIEIIIVDDASTDNTQEIIEIYQNKASIVVIKNKQNLGLTKSLKIGIGHARYDLIARLDADDMMLPGRLKYQDNLLRKNDYILSATNIVFDYKDEGIVFSLKNEDKIYAKNEIFLVNPFAHSSVTFKKSAYIAAGGYNPHFNKCQDFDLWRQMISYGSFHYSSQCFTKRTLHQEMITRKHAFEQFSITQKIRFRNVKLNDFLKCFLLLIRDWLLLFIPRNFKLLFVWKKYVEYVLSSFETNENKSLLLHLCTSLEIGGAQIAMQSMITNEYYKSKYQAVVVSFGSNSALAQELIKEKIPIINLKARSLFNSFVAFIVLFYLLLKLRPMFIYSWLYHTHFISIFLKLFYPNLRVLWAIHSWEPNYLKKSTALILNVCSKFSNITPEVIIYSSKASLKRHTQFGFQNSNSIVVENGIRDFRSKYSLLPLNERSKIESLEDKIIVGTVSRFAVEKDIVTFVKMAKFLRSKISNVHFVMIGAGFKSENIELMKLLIDSDIIDNITFFESSSDIGNWLKRMDVFCLTSKAESFPLVIGEAILSGTIPVATRVGDVERIILQDDKIPSYLICNPENPIELASSVQNVLSLSKRDYNNLISLMRAHIKSHFSVEKYVGEHIKIFTKNNLH